MPVAQKLNPLRPITGLDGLTITDFWVWAYSDILSNSNRSVFAEFMVGSALNVLETPRVEWDGVDFRYGSKKVEVKAAAYLQSWAQTKPSTISFDIGMKKAWDST